ncbi:hypothetical protein DICPUDRAFT_47371 [Dictyostelium purpureum]|uniref:Aminopeptidase n=1 Tax=Dictyostelium purpureum TaxID=5786 RepID=F0ZJ98_DICPU|nr:uncharacterized protein DICPUDRAFT_47371 [Dictyostelium purpureum]EGC35999.1 hypothetical protein DICPUDRAFT_47371 [Dictyostelium purpureum]|eukprot:XP_003287500.1 hypothetical protein DICPUDRAFT_47371 [Dictyostelium purpureum]
MKWQTNIFFIFFYIFIVLASAKKPSKVPINELYLIDKVDRLVLPGNVVPRVYNVHLNTKNIKSFKYKGEEDILLDIVKKTDTIVIHSSEIEIESAEILNNKAKEIKYSVDEEVAVFKFKKELPVSRNATLKIRFRGKINDKGRGFYRSKYLVDGIEHLIYSTQMEASDVRRVFPSFDEPSYKAIFNLKLTIDKDLQAISNTAEKKVTENKRDKSRAIEFKPTPKMSTYLVAFVIGDIEYNEGYSSIDKTRVRVYKGKGVKESSELALQIAIKTLDFFVDYFNISYPLKDLKLVAIPDFTFYAMENMGLLTFEDIYLLTSDKATLVNNKELVDMIAHEISHQWFGNLVTMEWWSMIWLNEGFAEFFGYFASASLYPEWNVWLEFSQNIYNKALYLDSLSSTHPVQLTVRTTSQIAEIFDDISYDKGASIVKMIQNLLGPDNFRNALRYYLKKYSYQNTVTQNLWHSFSLFSNGLNVSEFVNNYIVYPGYPIISIVPNGNTNTFQISQKRFTFDSATSTNKSSVIWNCFIKFQTEYGEFDFLLNKESDVITVPHPFNFSAGDWIKPNYGQSQFYRIEYSEHLLLPLVPKIKSLELPAVDRLGVLSDVFNSAKALSTQTSLFMDLVFGAYKSNESNGDVWTYLIRSVEEIQNIIFNQDYKQRFNNAFTDLLAGLSDSLGFDPKENEDAAITILRTTVNTKLVLLGYEPIINEAKQRYEHFKQDHKTLNPDISKVVFTSILNTGNKTQQDEIIALYLSTTDIAEKKIYLEILSYSAPTLELFNNMLLFSLNSSAVETNNIYFLWNTYKPEFKIHTFNFFVENFSHIDSLFKDNMMYPKLTTTLFCNKINETQLNQIKSFFNDNPVPMAESSIQSDSENIKYNTNWFNSYSFDLLDWLNNNYKL